MIDVGKLVGIASTQSATLMDIATGRCPIEMDSPPIAAVPTTAGSGSEATHFAVVYVGGNKFSVAHESMLPGFVVVDPQLTQSLPASITAVTGLDALCQAVESMWCIHSTEESISYSREAVTLVLNHLERAVREPTPCDRTAMCRASHLAGRAINLTKTTAPHAISYTLTARYGIPHGHAVALTLGPMLSYNSAVNDNDVADPRGAQHVQQVIHALNGLLCCADADESCNRIQRLIQSVHLPTRLRDVGATSDVDRQFLVDQVNMQRLANNPRRVTPEALADLLARIA